MDNVDLIPVVIGEMQVTFSAVNETGMVERLRAGDMEMLSLLYETYYPSVYRRAFSIVKDEEAAHDITQDTFIRFYKKLSLFDTKHLIRPWLIKIARNLALNWVDRVQRRRLSLELFEEAPDTSSVRFDDYHDYFDLRRHLNHALEQLRPEDQDLVMLHIVEEVSLREIATHFGISPNAVRIRLYRALKALRRPAYSRPIRDYVRS